jgi:hypothetical protein
MAPLSAHREVLSTKPPLLCVVLDSDPGINGRARDPTTSSRRKRRNITLAQELRVIVRILLL